jgi:single-stranded-DNA-specific exonuclease
MKSYRVREKLHDELLQHLLLARGIDSLYHEQFLNPDFERDSHDPYLLPGMDAAVERLFAAKTAGEHVSVWSDYDCDGIPGGVMLTEFLRVFGLQVTHYIPHRHREGYGLNTEGIDELKAAGVSLVVTVDLGTTEVNEIAYAKTLGIDVIVTDHHLVQSDHPLPKAVAILNPKHPDSKYPFDGLCGAGVAWKLVQALLQKDRSIMGEGQEKWLLDLVGIATLSDMVPLQGENRMLARSGLLVMKRGRRPGIAALLKLLRISTSTLTEDDITFMVSPRINAASRMDSPQLAARLLAADTPELAAELAAQLNRINDERKGLVASTTKEVNKRLQEMGDLPNVIVMGNPKWRPGILGLVANKLVESTGKTTFLWGREGGESLKGSCRAAAGVNVVELMAAARDGLDHFGGHAASGGFGVAEEKVHELPKRLNDAYTMLATVSALAEEVVLDRELDLGELWQAQRTLAQLSPFGIGNEKPLFMFPNVSISGVRVFGKAQDHLELNFTRPSAAAGVNGIAFFSTPDSFSKKVEQGMRADVVGNVELDWRGKPRIRVVDVL